MTARQDTLDLLKKLSDTHPELRIGQILANAVLTHQELFHISDNTLRNKIKKIEKFLK